MGEGEPLPCFLRSSCRHCTFFLTRHFERVKIMKKIREIRKNLGYSMEQFAKEIDDRAKSGTVSNWETGKNLPNNERLKRIAELGNTTVEQLLDNNDVEIPKKEYDRLKEIERKYNAIKDLIND